MKIACAFGDLKIRQANPGDLDEMILLLNELFSIEVDFKPDNIKNSKGLSLLMENPKIGQIFVAEKNNEVIGMITVQYLVSTAEGGKVGLVEDLVVLDKYRGQSIGTILLKFLENYAKEKGLLRLQLLADIENIPASDFYKNRSWKKTQLIAWRRLM